MSVPVTEQGVMHPDTGLWWSALEQEQTPELRWPKSVPVYGRMRREESQVTSVMRAVKMPVLRTPRSIDGTGCDPRVVQHVAEDLGLPIVGGDETQPRRRTKDRFSFPEHLRLALTNLDYGHSVFEQVYRSEGRRYRLRKLGWRPPSTITKFDEAADGGLKAIEQTGIDGKAIRLDISRLVVYANEREESWIGQSLLRPAYKYWLLKDQLLRIQQQTINRNGMGVPTYTAPAPPDDHAMTAEELAAWKDAQVAAGLAIAQQLRAGDTTGISLSYGAQFAMKGVEGKLPDSLVVIKYFDEQTARAVLAHFLNLGGDQSTGSYALGDTFEDFFTNSLQAVSDAVDAVVNAHIIEDLVDVNYGPDEPAPRLISDQIGAALSAEALKHLVDAGVITPDEKLESFTRRRFGLPVADPATARKPDADPASPAEPEEIPDAA